MACLSLCLSACLCVGMKVSSGTIPQVLATLFYFFETEALTGLGLVKEFRLGN